MISAITTCVRTVVLTAAVVSLAACEITRDRETGQRNVRSTIPITIPGTAAHGDRLEQRWHRCTRFYSRGVCDQRVRGRRPGDRPPTAPSAQPPLDPQPEPSPSIDTGEPPGPPRAAIGPVDGPL